MMFDTIRQSTRTAVQELLAVSALRPGDLFVLGASSSEILGEKIGTHGSLEAAQAVLEELLPLLQEREVFLAVQCCEHLNRCLILEERAALLHRLEPVNVVPQPHAGGSFATVFYSMLSAPTAVEHIRARAGMDIGQTLIGMHLAEVAVPVRTSVSHIGEAVLSLARTRPKFIGGARAQYLPR